MGIDAYGITYNQTGEDFLRKPIKQKAMCIRAGGGAGVIEINKCKENGRLGGKFEKMHEQSRRVYSTDWASPTIHTCNGGNTEIKIEFPIALDEQNKTLRFDYTVGASDGSSPKHNNRILHEELSEEDVTNKRIRIRKLTERECFRLMGVKEKEFDKIKKNQSKSSLYHLAGDSIVTTCLMAIFGEMTDVDWEDKVHDVVENIKEKHYE